jgi:hypothetical protein
MTRDIYRRSICPASEGDRTRVGSVGCRQSPFARYPGKPTAVVPLRGTVWAQPRLCAQTDVSPCNPVVHLRPEGGRVSRGRSALRLVVDQHLGTRIDCLRHGDCVTLAPVAALLNRRKSRRSLPSGANTRSRRHPGRRRPSLVRDLRPASFAAFSWSRTYSSSTSGLSRRW